MHHIHPTAVVEEGAKIGKEVVIEPYAIVKKHVTLGDKSSSSRTPTLMATPQLEKEQPSIHRPASEPRHKPSNIKVKRLLSKLAKIAKFANL